MVPPTPIPNAVASARIRLDATATRATITKLGAGLITPMLSAATMLASVASSCIVYSPGGLHGLEYRGLGYSVCGGALTAHSGSAPKGWSMKNTQLPSGNRR